MHDGSQNGICTVRAECILRPRIFVAGMAKMALKQQ